MSSQAHRQSPQWQILLRYYSFLGAALLIVIALIMLASSSGRRRKNRAWLDNVERSLPTLQAFVNATSLIVLDPNTSLSNALTAWNAAKPSVLEAEKNLLSLSVAPEAPSRDLKALTQRAARASGDLARAVDDAFARWIAAPQSRVNGDNIIIQRRQVLIEALALFNP